MLILREGRVLHLCECRSEFCIYDDNFSESVNDFYASAGKIPASLMMYISNFYTNAGQSLLCLMMMISFFKV